MNRLSSTLYTSLLGSAACVMMATTPAALAQLPDVNSGDQWDKLHNQSQTQRQVDRVKKDDWRATRERSRESRDWRPESDGRNGRRVDNDRSAVDWLDRERRRRD